MADETKNSLDVELSTMGETKKNKKGTKTFLIVSACVLIAALAVSAVLLLGHQDNVVRILDYGTVPKGVTVGSIDISGMTEEEVFAATADIPDDMLKKVKFSLEVNGETREFLAKDFGVSTDYHDIVAQAVAFGHLGTFEERKQAFDTASNEGVGFAVSLTVNQEILRSALADFKNTVDTAPIEAKCEFMPWGYLEDGTPFQPEILKMLETHAHGKNYVMPAGIVRIPDEERPNPLRYKCYNTRQYAKDYIPPNANIERFKYTEGVTGLVLDISSVAEQVLSQVENGDYSVIAVPAEVTEPTVLTEDVKKGTQLIASWTSSYNNSHYGYNRNYNIAKLSSIINGVIILPGETWSVNKYAGDRTYSGGWKPAAGISGGAFVPEPGGGVCQVSSTIYNAALRAGLEIPYSSRHSIISDYIPIGLDATISSGGGPDLKLKNPYDVPIYLVSYINGSDKNVTVEIYGPLPVDEQGREIIYDFTSKKTGSSGSPGSVTIESKTLPDGTPITPGDSKDWVKPRGASYATVYKHILLASDGSQLSEKEFYKATYRAITGKVYYNPPLQPTPGPAPTDEPGPPAQDDGDVLDPDEVNEDI